MKPGASTADYIDDVLVRITLPGAIFLAAIALVPIFLSSRLGLQQQFGGTSVLIVVGILLDTLAQVEQHRQLRKYDGFMKSRPGQVPGTAAAVHLAPAALTGDRCSRNED